VHRQIWGSFTCNVVDVGYRSTAKPELFDSFKFTGGKDFGAVIVAEAPVQLDYYADDTLFYHWMKENAHTLISNYREIIDSGTSIWIITKTYKTSKCSISCWIGSQQEISLSFGLDLTVEGVAAATPADASSTAVHTTGPGWAHYGNTEVLGNPVYLAMIGLI
jgi:hypothetical protein